LVPELKAGRTYRFRYLLEGRRCEHDWTAASYVPNDHRGHDSVVDLTALAEELPVASAEASVGVPAKKSTAKNATPARKPALTKTAVPAN
jgi:hypothetical protein